MKKIIAISVMFALVAGAVFADVSIGGSFGYKLDVVKGDNGKVWDPTFPAGNPVGYAAPLKSGTALDSGDNNINFNFSGDNYGGRVRVYATAEQGWWGTNPFAFAWWKPIDVFKFQLGHNPDGDWGAGQITGWGFNGGAQNYVAVDNDNGDGSTRRYLVVAEGATSGSSSSRSRVWKVARGTGFYGGYSNVGALLSFYPADIFTVNIALPFGSGHSTGEVETVDAFKTLHANFVVKVGEVGTARLTYVGGLGTKTEKTSTTTTKKTYGDAGSLWASFYLTSIENLAVDFGVGFGLAYKSDKDWGGVVYTKNPGVEIGLGVRYTVSDDFNAKLRIGAKLLREDSFEGESYTYPTEIGVQILPAYNLGALTAYFNAGFGMSLANETGEKNLTDWYINPYVRVPSGGLNFYAGIKLLGDTLLTGQYGATVQWAIPIGITVGF